MSFDPAHLLHRLADPFNSESRFYWPFAIAVVLVIVADTIWYYARSKERPSPGELAIRPWAYWTNVVFLIWALVLLIAKVPFYWYLVSFVVNAGALVYMYAVWLPPHEAAWRRELRRQKYIPKPERRRRRR